MRKALMFTMASCPYCQKARAWMSELEAERPEYRSVAFEIVDETLDPATAEKYDYYYVPTYYVGGVKVHEGAATKEIIAGVYAQALDADFG